MLQIGLQMLGSALLIIVLMPLIYMIDKRLFLVHNHLKYRQLILGILFAAFTALLLQMGVQVQGSLDNI